MNPETHVPERTAQVNEKPRAADEPIWDEVSAMRIPLTVTFIAIAMLASQLAFGQAASDKGQIGTQGTNGKPSGPAEGSGDSTFFPPQPAVVRRAARSVIWLAAGMPTPTTCRRRRSQKIDDAVKKIDTPSRDARAAGVGPRAALSNTVIQLSRIDTVTAVIIINATRLCRGNRFRFRRLLCRRHLVSPSPPRPGVNRRFERVNAGK